MPSSKHERLYGAPVQQAQKKKVGEPLTEGQTQAMIDAAAEGGLINDASGQATEEARKRKFRLPNP